MTVPAWIWFVEPLLTVLAASKQPMARRDLLATVPGRMSLSEADLAEMVGATRVSKARHRTGWALAHSSMAGLVESPGRSQWRITAAGLALLKQHPTGIPEEELQKLARNRRRISAAEDTDASVEEVRAETVATPAERMSQAYAEMRASMRELLLQRVRAGAPEFFERLVLDLLHKMGYGHSRDDLRQATPGADGGIDGVISVDRLGLEKVYVQAKRYAEDNPVSRPTIQAFLGALSGRRASKGVFITTSRFSRDAREFAERSSDSLVLLDGSELAELMMDYRVGVSTRETFQIFAIDGDYFEDE